MHDEHPALMAARNSWSCVQRKAKQEWLELMADDVLFEDPIGVSPLDPEGVGHRGKAALAAFWDKNMAPVDIAIEPLQSFAAGRESAHVLRLTTSFPNGVKMIVTGIFTYHLNDAGKLRAFRGYWSMDRDAKVVQPS